MLLRLCWQPFDRDSFACLAGCGECMMVVGHADMNDDSVDCLVSCVCRLWLLLSDETIIWAC